MQKEYDLKLKIVHVHHGLRGAEADRDLAFVKQLGQTWQIPCKEYHFDVKAEAVKQGVGEEEAGRKLRYASFYEEAAGGKVAWHTVSSVLMRICRGAGDGLGDAPCGNYYSALAFVAEKN